MKVLFGIGGSEDSLLALSQVVERTRATGDELTVAVLDNPNSEPTPEGVESRVRAELDEAGVGADIRRVDGDLGSRLCDIAESEGFDAIALGGGQRSPMGKIRLGPVAEFVVLNANTTVILVR